MDLDIDTATKAGVVGVVLTFALGVWRSLVYKADESQNKIISLEASLVAVQKRLDHVESMQNEIHNLAVAMARTEEAINALVQNIARVEARLIDRDR